MTAGNPLLDHMPMGYLGVRPVVQAANTGCAASGSERGNLQDVSLRKKGIAEEEAAKTAAELAVAARRSLFVFGRVQSTMCRMEAVRESDLQA